MLTRINSLGDNFTATLFNGDCDLIENIGIDYIGEGIISGCLITLDGLDIIVGAGVINVTIPTPFAGDTYTAPPNTSLFLYVSDSGALQRSPTLNPSLGVLLGQATTDASAVTSFFYDGRQDLSAPVNLQGPQGGFLAYAPVTGTKQLAPTEYMQAIHALSGMPAGNIVLVLPANAGWTWTFVNGINDGSTVTVTTTNGSGIVLTADKTCMVYCDGANILRMTPDV